MIVVHGDNSESQHKRTFPDDAPWVALPFESPQNSELSKRFSEGYVPCLYVVNWKGEKVRTGRETRSDLGQGAQHCWKTWSEAVEG